MKKLPLFAFLFLFLPLTAEALTYTGPCTRGDLYQYVDNEFVCVSRRDFLPSRARSLRSREVQTPNVNFLERTFSRSPSYSRERVRERINIRARRQFDRSFITITNTRDARREFLREASPRLQRSPLGKITTRSRNKLTRDFYKSGKRRSGFRD